MSLVYTSNIDPVAMLNIKIILGSTRPGRFSEQVAPWLARVCSEAKLSDAAVEMLDLRDYPMPFFDQSVLPSHVVDGAYDNEVVRAWAGKIREADAFIIIAPEYDHGYPAVLKNALDSVYAEWNKKPVSFVSYGGVGGARSVEQLRLVSIELQMVPIRAGVNIPNPWLLCDEKGVLKDGALDQYAKITESMLTQLLWWGQMLKAAREV